MWAVSAWFSFVCCARGLCDRRFDRSRVGEATTGETYERDRCGERGLVGTVAYWVFAVGAGVLELVLLGGLDMMRDVCDRG